MNGDVDVVCYCIDQDNLPPLFPTHKNLSQFWEQLGRTIATFGFLEEILGRAIFAITATRPYETDEIEGAYEKWSRTLEMALTDPLSSLADKYGKEIQQHPDKKISNVDDIVEKIKKAAFIRNVLCHASWGPAGADGKTLPRFVSRKKTKKEGELEKFNTAIDIIYLREVQAHIVELACVVINSVSAMGWQFPGGGGPGKSIWELH